MLVPNQSTGNMGNSPALAYVPHSAQPYVPNQAMQSLANPTLPSPRMPTNLSTNNPTMLRLPLQPVGNVSNNSNMLFPRMQSMGTTIYNPAMSSLSIQSTGIMVGNTATSSLPTNGMGQAAVAPRFLLGPSPSAQISSAALVAASPLFGPYGEQQVLAASGGINQGQGQAYGQTQEWTRGAVGDSAVGGWATGNASTSMSARAPCPARH